MRELWETIAHTSGAKAYSLLIGVFSLFVTARLLGPEGRGHVATITTWAALFSTFGGLSLGQVALHRIAGDRTQSRFGILFSSLQLLTAVLTLLGWSIALAIYYFAADVGFKGLAADALLVGFLAVPFMIWESYGSSLLIGVDRLRIYNRYQVVGRTLSVAAIFVLVWFLRWGVVGVMWAGLVGQIVVALGGTGVLLRFIKGRGLPRVVQRSEIKALLSGGAKLHLNAIGAFLYTSASILILNHYCGAEQSGYFQLANQLLGVLMIIPQAASMAMYAKVTNLGPNRAWPQNVRLLVQLSVGMLFVCALAALLAPLVVTTMAGEAFRPAVRLFQLMLLGVIGITFSAVMAPQWVGRGYFLETAGLTFAVGAVNLVANFMLIPLYGMYGAVYAFLGTYVVSIFGNGLMAWHCQLEFRKEQAVRC